MSTRGKNHAPTAEATRQHGCRSPKAHGSIFGIGNVGALRYTSRRGCCGCERARCRGLHARVECALTVCEPDGWWTPPAGVNPKLGPFEQRLIPNGKRAKVYRLAFSPAVKD